MPRRPSGRKYKQLKDRTLNIAEVFSLEEILEVNLGCKHAFKNNGQLTTWGTVCYELLVQILVNLSNIGVYRPYDAAKIITRLEMIKDEPDMVIEEVEEL